MENDLSVKIYGVLGNPAKHSLSPLMHNAAFSALQIKAEYRIFEKTENELPSFLASLQSENIFGLNVTVPYKEKITFYLDNLSEEANLIGAVNTIKVYPDKLEGYNTDGDGFVRHIQDELGFGLRGKSISMIGAGGAARAVSAYLCINRVKSISIFDIDKEKRDNLIESLQKTFKKVSFRAAASIDKLYINKADLLINSTPVGMKEADPCLINPTQIHKGLFIYDLIYNPKRTKLLRLAQENGLKFSNGLGMLLYQGVRSFEIWTQRQAPVEIMREALLKGVENL